MHLGFLPVQKAVNSTCWGCSWSPSAIVRPRPPRNSAKANKYQDYLYLHGFGVESAEALAEFWHKRMRQELGFGSEDAPKIEELFQQGYRGSRYSFGYPACPNLEDRAQDRGIAACRRRSAWH